MRTVDRASVDAPLERAFAVAADVERWPDFLKHYRWVRMQQRTERGGVVEMAAWRPFGLFRYPTWWLSEMEIVPDEHVVRYHHIGGITRGMDVEWKLEERGDRVDVTIVHEWDGPRWPLISRIAANWVIGPVFIHGIASRTLAGVKRKAESS
jgi:ribosome-associated toxin RatA of RatAB toxin-antitoxin module